MIGRCVAGWWMQPSPWFWSSLGFAPSFAFGLCHSHGCDLGFGLCLDLGFALGYGFGYGFGLGCGNALGVAIALAIRWRRYEANCSGVVRVKRLFALCLANASAWHLHWFGQWDGLGRFWAWLGSNGALRKRARQMIACTLLVRMR